jgi:hypothetical protein
MNQETITSSEQMTMSIVWQLQRRGDRARQHFIEVSAEQVRFVRAYLLIWQE